MTLSWWACRTIRVTIQDFCKSLLMMMQDARCLRSWILYHVSYTFFLLLLLFFFLVYFIFFRYPFAKINKFTSLGTKWPPGIFHPGSCILTYRTDDFHFLCRYTTHYHKLSLFVISTEGRNLKIPHIRSEWQKRKLWPSQVYFASLLTASNLTWFPSFAE